MALYGFTYLDAYSIIGIGLFLFFGFKMFYDLGKKIEIRDLIIIFAILQWIIGPMLAYRKMQDDPIYFMAVSQDVYMRYVVFAVIFYVLGLYFPGVYKEFQYQNLINNIKENILNLKNLDFLLVIIGFIAKFVQDFLPISVRFFVYLIANLRFIGTFMIFASDRKNKFLIFNIVYVSLFIFALIDAMFFDFILWSIFGAMYVAFVLKPTTFQKILALSAIFLFVVIIQTVKYYYRSEIAQNPSQSRIEIFWRLVQEKVFSGDYLQSDVNIEGAIVRINQGWIIARIMYWVPTYENYANGQTIVEAIKAALVPRFLNPSKITAGGRTYFTRFTGKLISENTSMGLSVVGEGYANFGMIGGMIFMFFLGLFYNFIISLIIKNSEKHPILFFFFPLIFLHVVKAETDFAVVLNYLTKSLIFLLMFYWVSRKVFSLNI